MFESLASCVFSLYGICLNSHLTTNKSDKTNQISIKLYLLSTQVLEFLRFFEAVNRLDDVKNSRLQVSLFPRLRDGEDFASALAVRLFLKVREGLSHWREERGSRCWLREWEWMFSLISSRGRRYHENEIYYTWYKYD